MSEESPTNLCGDYDDMREAVGKHAPDQRLHTKIEQLIALLQRNDGKALPLDHGREPPIGWQMTARLCQPTHNRRNRASAEFRRATFVQIA